MRTSGQVELENKWWHRLAKVMIWVITSAVTLSSILVLLALSFDEDFSPFSLLVLLIGPVIFGLLWVIYKKVILYIALGATEASTIRFGFFKWLSFPFQLVQRYKAVIVTVLIVAAVAGYYLYNQGQQQLARDLRHKLFEINLAFAHATDPFEYLNVLQGNEYNARTVGDGITTSKKKYLNWLSSDLYDLTESCAGIQLCKDQLSEHIITMSKALDAAREYYDSIGQVNSEDALFMRDQAFEMSRAVRVKYLMTPDPAFLPFTKQQVEQLINSQWGLYFPDFIEIKKLCDTATPYMQESEMYKNNCEGDLYYEMFVFNFTDDQSNDTLGLQSVCTLEKAYLGSDTCPLTLKKAGTARERYFDYLATHKNPYYSVSRLPEEKDSEDAEDSYSSSLSSDASSSATSSSSQSSEQSSAEPIVSSSSVQSTSPSGMNAGVCVKLYGTNARYDLQAGKCDCVFPFEMIRGACVEE